MRRVIILALMMALFASDCYALGGARLRMVGQSCTKPVTGETEYIAGTETPTNYLSNWQLTGGPCGTISYTANWDDYTLDWVVRLYSDVGMTHQIGVGVGFPVVWITGTVTGTVDVTSGPPTATLAVQGTLTR